MYKGGKRETKVKRTRFQRFAAKETRARAQWIFCHTIPTFAEVEQVCKFSR